MNYKFFISICAFLFGSCGNNSQTYYIPYSYIVEAFSIQEKFNTPYQVSRSSINDNTYIYIENMGLDAYRDSVQKRNIENGNPTIGIYLYDSVLMKKVIDSGSYWSVPPLLKDEAPKSRNAKLNMQLLPDGLYHLVISDVNSEFPLEIKILVSTR